MTYWHEHTYNKDMSNHAIQGLPNCHRRYIAPLLIHLLRLSLNTRTSIVGLLYRKKWKGMLVILILVVCLFSDLIVILKKMNNSVRNYNQISVALRYLEQHQYNPYIFKGLKACVGIINYYYLLVIMNLNFTWPTRAMRLRNFAPRYAPPHTHTHTTTHILRAFLNLWQIKTLHVTIQSSN